MQRADLVPACRIGREIFGGAVLTLALHRRKPLEIALDLRIIGADAGNQPQHEVTRIVEIRQAEERPRPLLVAADQPGLQEQLEMA